MLENWASRLEPERPKKHSCGSVISLCLARQEDSLRRYEYEGIRQGEWDPLNPRDRLTGRPPH